MQVTASVKPRQTTIVVQHKPLVLLEGKGRGVRGCKARQYRQLVPYEQVLVKLNTRAWFLSASAKALHRGLVFKLRYAMSRPGLGRRSLLQLAATLILITTPFYYCSTLLCTPWELAVHLTISSLMKQVLHILCSEQSGAAR